MHRVVIAPHVVAKNLREYFASQAVIKGTARLGLYLKIGIVFRSYAD